MVTADPLSGGDSQVLVCQLLAGCARRLLQLGMSRGSQGSFCPSPCPGEAVLGHLSLCCLNWMGYSTAVWNLV